MKKIQKEYEKVVNEYIKLFAEKQGIEFFGWVGDIVGGIADFGDVYIFNFQDIVWDINSEQPTGLILQWNYDCIENEKAINYFSYTKGLRHKDL
jgi:hypothetical protein